MPYISQDKRVKFENIIKELDNSVIDNPGELNYVITNVCLKYIKHNGINYTNLNSVSGVLNCVWEEIKDRIMRNYEYSKRIKNGDLEIYKKLEQVIKN